MFGDWLFVFPLGMGIEGAAIATVIGTSVQVLIMFSYFLRKKCRLKFVRPNHIGKGIQKTIAIGFSAGVLELSSVIIPVLINNQIRHYGSNTELAVYGVLASITPLFQALYGGVGQTIQPLISTNRGAGNKERVFDFWHKSLVTTVIFGSIFLLIGEIFPVQVVRLFVDASPAALQATSAIFRRYFLFMLPLGITIISTYYLQAIVEEKRSTLIAILRMVLFCITVFTLPVLWGLNGLWLALPCSEIITAAIAVVLTRSADYAKQ